MRRGREPKILWDEHGNTIAVNLSADYCAEHEWGIKSTRSQYEMRDDGFGLDRRRVRKASQHLRWITGEREAGEYARGKGRKRTPYQGFWFETWGRDPEPSGEVPYFSENTLSAGWSERDFGAFSVNGNEIRRLKEIYDAIQSLDAAIWLGGGGIFENAGLVIGIASRLPKEIVSNWDRHDRDQHALRQEFEATGIEKRLREAKKEWFALSPKRGNDGSLRVLLNPVNQDRNNWGFYTIADLDAWIRNEGPVPKRKGAAK